MAEDNYDASRNLQEQQQVEDARSTENNENTIMNAADVAVASGNAYAMAAGYAVKAADKITDGKSTEFLAKGMTKANKTAPGGKMVQGASNKLAESGMGDKIGTAASMKGGGGSAASKAGEAADKAEKAKKAAEAAQKTKQAAENAQKAQQNAENAKRMQQAQQNAQANAQKAKKAEEDAKKMQKANDSADAVAGGKDGGGRRRSSPSSDDGEDGEKKGGGLVSFLLKNMALSIGLMFAPFLIFIVIVLVVIALVTGIFGDYTDAIGMSSTMEEETGGLIFNASSEEQEKFYNRINDVKLSYQASGKSFDAMKIIAIFHVLQSNNVDIKYDDVTESVIRNWADSMFEGNYYSEETFRNNLKYSIFPSYIRGKSDAFYEEMTDDVFDYIDRYYNLIGKEMYGSSCASIGNCSYNIKGFAINGRGNVLKNMQISDLKVRLMECGSPYGNGNDKTPIDQDMVNFEDYIAGVAYAEVGPSANEEVLKAQMVAARSFALSRPTAMGNAAGKKLEQENGQWVLQIASCVSDQVFCNIDLGCSYMGGGDGQGGICRSGKVPGAQRTRDPLPEDHAIRRAAAATQGEVLVNSQGFIVSTGYKSSTQNNWSSLAASGLNYKQILLQTYGNTGATDIEKASCNATGASSCISTGEFSKWKQTDPQWAGVPMGSSGKTVSQIGCLVTSISMLLAKSGTPVNVNPLNPGTFVQFLNSHGGINSGGNYVWASVTQAAPAFHYAGHANLSGLSREQKLNRIKEIVSQPNVYAVVEVKGNTGQHWVAIDSVTGSTINMMDPSTDATDMWAQYNWANTSIIEYYRVG